jgi:hypothetical protein
MPAADFCGTVRVNRFTLSHESVTRRRPPEVSSTAFDAQPPDLPPAALMDVGFAVSCPLARCRRPPHPVFVHRLASLLRASFRPRLATTPLRFAITSPPSGCEKDSHLQAVEHARHTRKGRVLTRPVRTSLCVGVSQNVSQNYFGCVACGFGATGVVVAGLVPGAAAGFDAAGLTGAGTPDCVL